MNAIKKHPVTTALCTSLAIILLTVSIFTVFNNGSMTAQGSGTVDDPLISLSYVNTVLIPQIKSELITEVKTTVLKDFESAFKETLSTELAETIKASILADLGDEFAQDIEDSVSATIKDTIKEDIFEDLKTDITSLIETEVQNVISQGVKLDLTDDMINEISSKVLLSLKTDITSQITDSINAVKSDLEASIKETVMKDLEKQGIFEPCTNGSWIILELSKGQIVRAKGTLEVIHRAGECFTLSHFPSQGIADLTASKELLNGDFLTLNNYFLIPRGDGRGIEISSDIAFLMVRGEFTIE